MSFFFDKVFDHKNISEFPQNDPFWQTSKANELAFTRTVDIMRTHLTLPCPKINELMALFWDLVGSRISPVAITDQVKTVHLWVEVTRERQSMAVVVCPTDWYARLREEPYMQMGALAFIASQSKDYWNNKINRQTGEEVRQRALSAESHLLHFFQKNSPDFTPNDYQKQVMENHQEGFLLSYQGRLFDGKGPPYPINK